MPKEDNGYHCAKVKLILLVRD